MGMIIIEIEDGLDYNEALKHVAMVVSYNRDEDEDEIGDYPFSKFDDGYVVDPSRTRSGVNLFDVYRDIRL